MKTVQPSKQRYGLMGIRSKTALLAWLTIVITLTVFVAVILPEQKRTFLENMRSKARGTSVSLQDVAAGAVVTEDYSAVVDHCMEILGGDESVEYLVLTRNDGFSLIHVRDGWRSDDLSEEWRPADREPVYGIGASEFAASDVYRYSRPFEYSGIEWGWIHIGLSLDAFNQNVQTSYTRTAWLTLFCVINGLLISVIYSKRIVTPILRLRQAVLQVAAGDLNVRAEVNSRDEVEALADDFNAMTQTIQDRQGRLYSQNKQLATLVTDTAVHGGDVTEAARRITEASADTLGVERVSIWLYTHDRSAIECIDQFTLTDRKHTSGAVRQVRDNETYFTALEATRALAITEVADDPRTTGMIDDGVTPLQTSSMLDAAIRLGGEVIGVVCNEHVGDRREWNLEEENFTGSIADLITLAFEARNRRAAQEELISAKEAAEAASEAKSQFLANMSHEIRTPINGVMGMLQLLEKDDLSDRQQRFVGTALSSADTLLTVIGDVLDFSKIEAGHLTLENAEFSLRDAVDRAVRLFAEKAGTQGVELSYAVGSDMPDKVLGDSNRLRQVLINLVGNAMKFTEAGEIHVECRLAEQTESDVTLHFSVRDTGPGIPQEQQETIFHSFAQGDASMRRRHGGSGLGLAISRHLVELMDGEIGVASTAGEGSTFWFRIRLALQSGSSAEPPDRLVSPIDQRILVVDDSDTACKVVCNYARSWGCHVDRAANASQALERLRQAAEANQPYAIALIDSQMPGIDGLRLAKLIVQDERIEAPRMILLSGLETPSGSKLRECGIEAFVSKPVRASELYDAIMTVTNGSLAKTAGERNQDETKPMSSMPCARILLVEDNEINQEVAREMITGLGHQCECLNSGSDALTAAASGLHDLVLMDCQMPGMDGYAATAQIRTWENSNRTGVHIPIIALTAHAMAGDRDRCLAAGMDDYLSKPLQASALAAMLQKWLTEKRPAAPPATVPEQPSAELRDAPAAPEEDVEMAVLERCGGNRSLASRLLRKFIIQTNEDISTITSAAQEGDPDRMMEAAHRLKGAAGNLGLQESAAVAANLEKQGREGKVEGTQELISALRKESDRVAKLPMLLEADLEKV